MKYFVPKSEGTLYYKYTDKNEVMKWTREVIDAVNMSGEVYK